MMRPIAFLVIVMVVDGCLMPIPLQAEDIARLQSGVVKITAKSLEGNQRVGTGFIVRLDKDAAYIVTAAHVVSGDPHPQVEFFTKRNAPVSAEVFPGAEGGDEVRGLALLMVKGKENIPSDLVALPLASNLRLSGGEDIILIGFPRGVGPWAVIKGNISSRQGRDIYFSPTVGEGNSGGPIVQNGKVVGLVGAGGQLIGRGVTVRSIEDYIEGFGITIQEAASAKAAEVPSASTAETRRETSEIDLDREIIGKDGAPMVLIPAGEFWMGSFEEERRTSRDACLNPPGKKVPVPRGMEEFEESMNKLKREICERSGDELPRHRLYLDPYYMDKFEVTISRYAEFMQWAGRHAPDYWDQFGGAKYHNLPVVGVDWYDAESYCRWAGKRLPTEAEWEKAARGTDGRRYPWGNEMPTDTVANFNRPYQKNKSAPAMVLSPVNSYEASKSPYGILHMAGNVSEWVADWYGVDYYQNSPARNPTGPSDGTWKVKRGGAWYNDAEGVRSAGRGAPEAPSSRGQSIAVPKTRSDAEASTTRKSTSESCRASPRA